jgi:GNAT superfamily N-acetyltransferase
MAQSYLVTFEETPDPGDARYVSTRLTEYNRQYAEPDNYRKLAIFIRDGDNAIVGGLLGETYWGWLHVSILWIDESLRHRSYGKTLLAAAEREAIQRGCHHAHLNTMSFQALPFYEQQGYEVVGVLDDMPAGHKRYLLKKTLSP